MNVIIIEDEAAAREKLISMLKTAVPGVRILACLESVEESIRWLQQNPPPDVAFVDIQLSDDDSFKIFEKVQVQFPIIFTTAFDQYLLRSFEYNSIDYLLKPITADKLKRSLEKIKKLELHFVNTQTQRIAELIHPAKTKNNRILAKKGVDFVPLAFDDIAYFYTEHKITFVIDRNGERFIVDQALAELGSLLDENGFFRLNRQYLVCQNAVEKFRPETGKIRVFLNPPAREEVLVSKENAPEFRKWVAGK